AGARLVEPVFRRCPDCVSSATIRGRQGKIRHPIRQGTTMPPSRQVAVAASDANPTSVSQIDLSPLPGKVYFNSIRPWREQCIYFLLVDRFHDDRARTPATSGAGRSSGGGTRDVFCGGRCVG